ncbi:MAG: glycosyltransferase family 4 protein [Microgenomates group bacterium]
MKICIDARLYGLENAGIGRYVMNLIKEIEGLDKENQYFILLKKKYFKKLKFKNKNFKKVLADYPHYSFKEQFFLPILLFKLKPDLVHFPHFNVPIFWFGDYVVTIHDLIKHYFKGKETTTRGSLFYWFKYLNYRLIVWWAIKRAKKIITPSNFWKKELIKKYRLSPKKIEVTYEGVENKFKILNFKFKIDRFLTKYKIKRPFVVYTGSLYPHKNIETLIKAIKEFNQIRKLYLVIVCARNIFQKRLAEKVKKLEAEEYVKFIGFVSDKELSQIYKAGEAFIFPSLMEGFGLPALEAMAVGLPVIASDIPVFREVYKEAVLYFDPHSEKDLIKKLGQLIENKEKKAFLIKKGKQLVKNYSWKKMASQTIEIYKNLKFKI